MNVPTLFAADVLSESSPVTIGLVVWGIVVGIAWGEARWQISHLREKDKQRDVQHDAAQTRLTSIEVREGRTLERLDALADRLNRIEAKLDKLLERREHTS